MEASAEWRMKNDTAFAKNKQMQDELLKVWSIYIMYLYTAFLSFLLQCSFENLVYRLRPHSLLQLRDLAY